MNSTANHAETRGYLERVTWQIRASLLCKRFKCAHDAQILRVSDRNIQPWHRVATFQGHAEKKCSAPRIPIRNAEKQEGRKQVEGWDASKRFFLLSLLPAFLFFALRISHAFPAADGGAGMPHEFEFLVPAPGRARSSAVFLLFFFFPN